MFLIPSHFFGSNSPTIHIPFRPYSLEILITIKCLLLGETCRSSFAFCEGPMPNLLLFAPWSDLLPNSAIFPSPTSPWLKYANFWLEFLKFLYSKSQFTPLSSVLLSHIRRDLIIFIEKHTTYTISCSYHAEILLSYETLTPVFLTTLTFSRTYFEITPPPISLGGHWLYLREQFNSRQTLAPRWSLDRYLTSHLDHYSRFCNRQRSHSGTSSCSTKASSASN